MRQFILGLIIIFALATMAEQAQTFTKQVEHYYGTSNNWVDYNPDGIYVQVTFPAGVNFTTPPYVHTFLACTAYCWQSKGVTSIYNLTTTGFRVYLHYKDITPAQANTWNWKLHFKIESLD